MASERIFTASSITSALVEWRLTGVSEADMCARNSTQFAVQNKTVCRYEWIFARLSTGSELANTAAEMLRN